MSKINIIHKKLHEEGEGLHFVHNETIQDGVVKETYEIGLPDWLNNQKGLYNTIAETVLDTIHSKSLSDKTYIENDNNKNYFILASALTEYVTHKLSDIENIGSSITITEQVEKDNNNAVSSGGVYNAIASHIEEGHHWNTVTGKHYRLNSDTDSPNTSVIHRSGEYIILYYSFIAANAKGVAMAADTYNYISSAIFDKTVDSIHDGTSDTDFASVGAVKDYVNAQINNIEFPTSDNITELFFPELSKEERANYIIWSNNNPVYISFADKITNGESAFRYDSLISSFAIDLPNLENAARMFGGCYNLKNFSADITSIHNGTYMFSGCKLNKKSILKILTDIINSEKTDLGYEVDLDIYGNPGLFYDPDFIAQLSDIGINISGTSNYFKITSAGGKKWNIELHFDL